MRIPETTEEKIAQLQLLVGKVKELETKESARTVNLGYAKSQMDT